MISEKQLEIVYESVNDIDMAQRKLDELVEQSMNEDADQTMIILNSISASDIKAQILTAIRHLPKPLGDSEWRKAFIAKCLSNDDMEIRDEAVKMVEEWPEDGIELLRKHVESEQWIASYIRAVLLEYPVSDVIVDLEASCWDSGPPKQMETIEIGAVKINGKGEIIDEFDVFIKPILFPVLSKFCRSLTHITQNDVDNGMEFRQAIAEFYEWTGDARVWSWGEYDRKQLEQDAKIFGIDVSFLAEQHCDLSGKFKRRHQIGKRCGTRKALSICDMEFEGTQHRGIDDARNLARVFLYDREWYIENFGT